MKQTAVDWLIKKLYSHSPHIDILDVASLNGYWKQAKQMEKEQIEENYDAGYNSGCSYMYDGKKEFKNKEQYYKETYEQK